MKRILMIIFALAILAFTPNRAHAVLVTEVQFQSPSVFVLGGYNNQVTYSQADLNSFRFYTRDDTGDGLVDVISVDGDGETAQPFSDTFWSFQFATRRIVDNLTTGTYLDVDRYPFETNGHAGFAAGISGVGLDSELPFIYGEFEILDFQYDYLTGPVVPNVPDPKVLSFASTFRLYNTQNQTEALNGHIYYNYDPNPDSNPSNVVPEPASALLFAAGLVGTALRRRNKKEFQGIPRTGRQGAERGP